MAENTVDIDQVEPDIDPLAVGIIKNPLMEDFTHQFAGKDITIPAATEKKDGKTSVIVPGQAQYPLPVCVHIAKHLAEKIIRDEFRSKVTSITDDKVRDEESRKAIPNSRERIFEKMAELVETESDFFSREGIKSSFIR